MRKLLLRDHVSPEIKQKTCMISSSFRIATCHSGHSLPSWFSRLPLFAHCIRDAFLRGGQGKDHGRLCNVEGLRDAGRYYTVYTLWNASAEASLCRWKVSTVLVTRSSPPKRRRKNLSEMEGKRKDWKNLIIRYFFNTSLFFSVLLLPTAPPAPWWPQPPWLAQTVAN